MATIVALVLLVSIAVTIGAAIVLISAGIHGEERHYTLTSKQAPGRVSEGARRFTGLSVRDVVSDFDFDREITLV
jgi:hypothetical protein